MNEVIGNVLKTEVLTDLNFKQIDQIKCISKYLAKTNTNFTDIPADIIIIDIQGNYRLELEQFKSFISTRFNPE